MVNKLHQKVHQYFSYFRNIEENSELIFVYQMGKVGSTSLEQSLPHAMHIHSLYPNNSTCPPRQKGLLGCGLAYYFNYIKLVIRLFLTRRAIKNRKNIKIITLVREPVARNISMFFHDLDAYVFNAHTNLDSNKPKTKLTRFSDSNFIVDLFEQEFEHTYPLNWFDKEIKRLLGVDIYQYPFDKEKGLALIESGRVQILCLKLSALNDNLQAISNFCGQGVRLQEVNTADKKWYSELYQQFKQRYTLCEARSHNLFDSRYVRHFFSDEEITSSKERYSAKANNEGDHSCNKA